MASPVALDLTGETSPYPFFEYMRRTDPVWHGSLADHSQMPEELRPNDEWVLFGYDGLFQAFRDDRVFTSAKYDQSIGLVMGHTILAMGGKEHHDHRSLVAKAFRATALERWEPSVIGPVCDQLIDEIKNEGHADPVRALTFEFPTRIISVLLGLPHEDLDLFRRLSLDLISIPTDITVAAEAQSPPCPADTNGWDRYRATAARAASAWWGTPSASYSAAARSSACSAASPERARPASSSQRAASSGRPRASQRVRAARSSLDVARGGAVGLGRGRLADRVVQAGGQLDRLLGRLARGGALSAHGQRDGPRRHRPGSTGR